MTSSSKTKIDQELMRHSMAHILVMAIVRLFPNTKIGIGPAIENGFYYEVDSSEKISYKDFPKIEEEMQKIINEELPFKQIIVPKEQAFDTLMQSGQIYKTELLKQINDESVSFYKTGEFFDLCRGPHLEHTGQAGFFKLTKISNSYWLGDKSRPKLQRIEGVAFLTKEELDNYLTSQKEIIQRDYKKIGRRLNLITYDEEIGDNLLIWLPKGNAVKEELLSFITSKIEKIGTIALSTPNLGKLTLFRDYFDSVKQRESYLPLLKTNNNEYLIRNDCFYHHSKIFKSIKKSYRQLPVRFSEYYDVITLGNPESNKDINFYQKLQVNIFSREDQIQEEIEKAFELISDIYSYLRIDNLQILAKLPDPKDKSSKIKESKKSLKVLEKALAKFKLSAKIVQNEFYNDGAELVFLIKDIYGNNQILTTIKIDLSTALKEGLYYINRNNQKELASIIKFTIIDSFETLFKLIIEKNQGEFDVWLAPIQCVIISISEKYHTNAIELLAELKNNGIRASINIEAETMQSKIRKAENEKIPYMLIIGEKEINTNSISLRQKNGQELGLIRVDEFIEKIKNEVDEKSI